MKAAEGFRKIRFILGVVLALGGGLSAFTGCNVNGCIENQSAVPYASFKSYATGETISLDSLEIRGEGAPNDTVLLSSGRNSVTGLYLPMRPNQDNVTWLIGYKKKIYEASGISDRIKLDYKAEPYFASEECGAFYRYRITHVEYTREMIDSLAICDSLVTNIDKTYIEIYFRTEEEGSGEGEEE